MRFGKVNLLEGVIWRSIALYALPLLLSNFLQQLNNTADLLIVGRYASDIGMASVGATGPVTNMLIGLAVGFASGAMVVVSQCYGAEDYDGLYKTVHTGLAVAVIGGVILTGAGIWLAPPLLRAMNTPVEILAGAITYMRLIFAGMIPTLIYNIGAGILNAVGDSKRPFFFLAFSATLNVILDVVFIVFCKWGVAGAAVATSLSQTVAATLVLRTLITADTPYRIFLKDIRVHGGVFKRIVKIGLPAGTQSVVVSLANTFVQTAINGYGAYAVAGVAVANRIDSFIFVAMASVGLSTMTFTGQNTGAGLMDRVRRGLRTSMVMTVTLSLSVGFLVLAFSQTIVSWFNDDPRVIDYATRMMWIMLPLYFIFGLIDVMGGFMRGRGKSFVPMLSSLIFMTGGRLLWIWLATPIWPEIETVFYAYPIAWILNATFMFFYVGKTFGFRTKRDDGTLSEPNGI